MRGIFFKVAKIAIYPKKKLLNLFNMGHGDFARAPELRFCFSFFGAKNLSLQIYTGTLIHFQSINLQDLAIVLFNND